VVIYMAYGGSHVERADPWAQDAEWISNGGNDADVQKDIEVIQNLETPVPAPAAVPQAEEPKG
jgi:hypothetical protein